MKRRLVLRNLFDHQNSTGVRFVERGMLSRLSRFWLCVARYKHLKNLKTAGVKGANRGTRIEELARDLRVPIELVRLYNDADAEDYDYFPPASFDLQVAECESGHRLPKRWVEVRQLEENMGGDEEEIISDREDGGSTHKGRIQVATVIPIN